MAGKADVWVIVVVVWQRLCGGGQDVLGKRIEMDGRHATIIGVMPPGFRFPMAKRVLVTACGREGAKRRVGYCDGGAA
jgi:hypothetical protein